VNPWLYYSVLSISFSSVLGAAGQVFRPIPVGLRAREKPLELNDYKPVQEGLVAWWRGEGNAYESAGGQNGVLMGVRFDQGVVGQAFSFQGNPNRVFVPDSPNFQFTNSFSIAAWAYPKAASWHILERTCFGCPYGVYSLGMDNAGKLIFKIHDNDSNAGDSITAPLEYNRWQHVAASLDGESGMMRLYIGGEMVSEKPTRVRPTGSLDPRLQPGIGIGNTPNTGGYPFVGLIDELLLYSRALSADQVKSLATLKHGGPEHSSPPR
jgi:hypothetical protein